MAAFDENIAPLGDPCEEGSLLEFAQETRVSMLKDGQGLDDLFELLWTDHLIFFS
jgi:hypothetical protein